MSTAALKREAHPSSLAALKPSQSTTPGNPIAWAERIAELDLDLWQRDFVPLRCKGDSEGLLSVSPPPAWPAFPKPPCELKGPKKCRAQWSRWGRGRREGATSSLTIVTQASWNQP